MNDDSKVFGISIRGVLALIIVVCCCVLALIVREMNVLKDLALLALGFYFGQKSLTPSTTNGEGYVKTTFETSSVSQPVKPPADISGDSGRVDGTTDVK